MSQFIDIGAVEDIPQRGARLVKSPLGEIAVFRTAKDEIFAVDEWLPGKAGPLSNGIQHDTRVTDPMRNWVFDLATGEAQGADEGRVRVWETRVEEGRILITQQVMGELRAAE